MSVSNALEAEQTTEQRTECRVVDYPLPKLRLPFTSAAVAGFPSSEWIRKFDDERLRREIGDGRHRARQCWCDRDRADGSASAAARGPGGSARGGDFSDCIATAGTAIQRPRGVVQLGPGQVHHPAQRGSAVPHAAEYWAVPHTHRIRRRHQEHLRSHRTLGALRIPACPVRGRLDSVGGLARSSNRHLLSLRGTHRPKHRVQFRRLALGPAALPRGLGKHRRG